MLGASWSSLINISFTNNRGFIRFVLFFRSMRAAGTRSQFIEWNHTKEKVKQFLMDLSELSDTKWDDGSMQFIIVRYRNMNITIRTKIKTPAKLHNLLAQKKIRVHTMAIYRLINNLILGIAQLFCALAYAGYRIVFATFATAKERSILLSTRCMSKRMTTKNQLFCLAFLAFVCLIHFRLFFLSVLVFFFLPFRKHRILRFLNGDSFLHGMDGQWPLFVRFICDAMEGNGN